MICLRRLSNASKVREYGSLPVVYCVGLRLGESSSSDMRSLNIRSLASSMSAGDWAKNAGFGPIPVGRVMRCRPGMETLPASGLLVLVSGVLMSDNWAPVVVV